MTDIELTVERIVAGGAGLARTPDGVVLVRGALPGERVLARVEAKKGHRSGHVLTVLEPHPARVDLPLPPGADLPMRYEDQLPVKAEIVRETLARIGGIEREIDPVEPSPDPLGYRTAAQYAITRSGALAGRETGSRNPVPLREDPLIAPPLAAAFAEISRAGLNGFGEALMRGSIEEGTAVVAFTARSAMVVKNAANAILSDAIAGVAFAPGRTAAEKATTVAGRPDLLEDFGGIKTTVTVRSFAQVNPKAAGLLYREAAAIAGSGERVIDLYAGSGVLALHLAAGFSETVAVEISADAVRRGDADRKRLGIDSLRFVNGDAAAISHLGHADVISVNPPRSGIDADVITAIAEAAPAKVLYVSCDPPSWARDVKRLTEAGYTLTYARPYDFYPYTHHVEMLSLLTR